MGDLRHRLGAAGATLATALGTPTFAHGAPTTQGGTLDANAGSVTTVRAVAAGMNHTLVLRSDGTVWGVGDNTQAQLTGDPTLPDAWRNPYWRKLAGQRSGVPATRVWAADRGSFVYAGGRLRAAGDNYWNQLGVTGGDKTSLTPVTGLPTGAPLSLSGRYDLTLVVGSDGRVYGAGDTPEVPDGQGFHRLAALPSGSAREVSVNDHGSYVRTSTGRIYGLGMRRCLQSTSTEYAWVTRWRALKALPGGRKPAQLAATDCGLVVRTTDGRVYGTGSNDTGQLTGSATWYDGWKRLSLPSSDAAARRIAYVDGDATLVATRTRLYGTGANHRGQLGRPVSGPARSLVQARWWPKRLGVAEISGGRDFAVALTTTSRTYGTGWNYNRQLARTTAGYRDSYAVLGSRTE